MLGWRLLVLLGWGERCVRVEAVGVVGMRVRGGCVRVEAVGVVGMRVRGRVC